MATHPNTDRKDPQAPNTPTGNTAKDTDTKPAEGKDPDVYNPVGMAGQKAGIVEEIAQQLEQEADIPRPETGKETPRSKGIIPADAGPTKEQA